MILLSQHLMNGLTTKPLKWRRRYLFIRSYLVPVIVIVTGVAGLIFGQKAATGQLITAVSDYVGLPTAELIQSIILNAYVPESGIIPIVIGLIFFIWTSLTVFVEIRSSLNSIWGIEVKPGKGIKEFFRGRLFSLLILIMIGLIFILSLMAGILLNFADDILSEYFGDVSWLLGLLDNLLSFAIVILLFTITYKYLPSVKTNWKYAFIGAIITTLLFKLGIFMIDFYLSRANYSSVYGATGSLVVLLLWIYYSSLIFFFGAD